MNIFLTDRQREIILAMIKDALEDAKTHPKPSLLDIELLVMELTELRHKVENR